MPLLVVALPALIALSGLTVAWRKRENAPKSSEPARCAGAWSFGIAMLAACWAVFGSLALPIGRTLPAKDWLPICIVGAMLLSTLALVERVHRVLPRGGAGLIVAALVLLQLRVKLEERGGMFEILAVFAALLLTWSAVELSSERLRGPLPCLVLALASALGAATIFESGDGASGRLCGSLAALFVAAAVVAWRRRVFTLSGGPAAIATLVLGSCWINGWAFSSLPLKSAILLCAAVVVPGYAGIGPLSTWTPLRREIARAALTAALGGAALWIAIATAPPRSPYGY